MQVINVDESNHGESITLGLRDRLAVVLPESPSTGYRWAMVKQLVKEAPIKQILDDFQGAQQGVGGRGSRKLVYSAVAIGEWELRLENRREWEVLTGGYQPVGEFTIHITVAKSLLVETVEDKPVKAKRASKKQSPVQSHVDVSSY